jgi:AraC-like DNA-binding protein
VSEDKDNPPLNQLPQFGYSGEAQGAEFEFWREEMCRRVLVADVVPLDAGPIDCQFIAAPLPRVSVIRYEGTSAHFISQGITTEFAMVLPSGAPMHLAMRGRIHELAPHELGLADSGLDGADVAIREQGQLKSMFIDRKALLDLCPAADDLVARPLKPNPGIALLLSQYHDVVMRTAASLDAEARAAVAQHLIDLTALSLGAHRDAEEQARDRGLAAARLEAIKADILARLGDGGLSLTQVAQRHRASPRYVQMLFERSGTTFSDFVLEQRLLTSYRLLGSPLSSSRKVSDIAHMSGFGDVSYFHRAFRKRFGATPADIRSQAKSRT